MELSDRAVTSPQPSEVIPIRRPGRWIATGVVLVIVGALIHSFVVNPRFQWDVVGHYFFSRDVVVGLAVTLELTVAAMVLGIVGGVVLAVMRLSPNKLFTSVSWFYVWFFRGTPVLVQLLFWFNIQALYPRISLGLGFGPALTFDANSIITPLVAAIVGLGMNEAAYMAEITRAGILAVDQGQTQAAQALGMTRLQTIRRIVLPQAMRVIIPPTANETIGLLKTSSLASVITVTELLYSAQLIYSINYLTIQLLIVASIWYLVVTTILTVGQYYLERQFNRDSSGPQAGAPTWRRILSLSTAITPLRFGH